MTHVLITGGAGVLGRAAAVRLLASGATARVMSRRPRLPNVPAEIEWAQADLATGQGLAEAVAGVGVILHAASNAAENTRQVDVDGTRRLLETARAAGGAHLVYISIVGIDRVPLDYYQHKLAAEAVITAGSLPWTILRTTQFYELIDRWLHAAASRPRFELPADHQYQPLAVDEAAEALCQAALAVPAGRLPDMGGPQVLTYREMGKAWLRARGLRRRIVNVPREDAVGDAMRGGGLTCPDRAVGRITWAQWLGEHYARGAEAAAAYTASPWEAGGPPA